MAAVAMNADTKERIDLSGNITEETIVWKVPEGNWKIMAFVWRRGRRSEHGLSERRGGQSLHFDDARGLLQTDARIFRKDDHFDLFRRTDAVPRAGPLLDADIQRDLHKKIRLQPGAVLSGALVRHRPGNAGRAERPIRSAGRALRSGLSESGQRVEQSARHRCDRTSG